MHTQHSGKQQQQVVEVSAGAKPSEVVAAVIAGAQGARSASNPNRGIQFAFVFLIVFALTIYFREELWSISRDVSKHPIMAPFEQLQISHYLGSKWLFGTGKDTTLEEVDIAKLEQQVAATPSSTQTPTTGSNGTTATATAGGSVAPAATTQAAATSAGSATQPAGGGGGGSTGGTAAVVTPSLAAVASTSVEPIKAAAAGPGARRSWARRLLTVHHSKCDNSKAKMLMRRLLMLAHRQRHLGVFGSGAAAQ